LLTDGNVLVVGGVDVSNTVLPSAEIYCVVASGPCLATDMFVPTAGPLSQMRYGHTATLLADGNVLIAGGATDTAGTPTDIAEIYCASSPPAAPCAAGDVGKFKTIATAMVAKRSAHTATALNDGTVLLAGGFTAQLVRQRRRASSIARQQ
jgi:hypothetical protein